MATALAVVEQPAEFTCPDADRLGAEITELCSYIYAAESRLLALIREFDEKEYWAQQGLCSCAHWLNFKCGIGMNAAREKVRVAHALAQLPKISAGFAKGALSYSCRSTAWRSACRMPKSRTSNTTIAKSLTTTITTAAWSSKHACRRIRAH